MASVCGGTLALMDAGVPIKKPIAGIAMGMLLGDKGRVSDDNAVILSDILGTEDALGTMDFKVAGDREGITTFQLDIKCEGLTVDTMERALAQAKDGRAHLLDEMDKILKEPRADLPETVPKIRTFTVPVDSIGKIIGPGGKQIRSVIEDFSLDNMNVDDDGNVQVTGFKSGDLEKAETFVKALLESGGGGGRGRDRNKGPRPEYAGPPAQVGKTYRGKIMGVHNFGVFVEILPGAEDGSTPGLEGLCHISELHTEHVRSTEGFIRSLGVEEIDVRYLGKNDRGKLQLSRKAVLQNPVDVIVEGGEEATGETKSEAEPARMSADEIDVIARAIEGLSD